MNRKIITNYHIQADPAESADPKQPSHARVLSQARISDGEQKIASQREKNQPRIDVLKNAHGVITTLVITCGCGEEITILLDYE